MGDTSEAPLSTLFNLFGTKAFASTGWSVIDDSLYLYMGKPGDHFVGYDLDWTLVYHKRKFASDDTTWKWLNRPTEPNIVIITNQLNKPERIDMLDAIRRDLEKDDINVWIAMAMKHDWYRKPCIKILDYIPKLKWYCGDAYSKEHFSQCDLFFAYNARIPFKPLEDRFGGTPLPYSIPDIELDPVKPIKPRNNIIMMCGPPGSGKSTIAKSFGLPVYSQDTHTKSQIKKAIKAGGNIIIDNTHSTKKSRDDYLKLIDSPVTCLYTCPTKERTQHLLAYRCLLTNHYIPEVAWRMWYSKHEPPTEEEFDEIILFSGWTFNDLKAYRFDTK